MKKQVFLLLVVDLDLVNYWINPSSVIRNIIYVAMKIYATDKQLVFVLKDTVNNNNNNINSKKETTECFAHVFAVCEQILSFFYVSFLLSYINEIKWKLLDT